MISVVVPFFNERGSIRELHSRLVSVLKKTGEEYEIVFVDDGSSDGTFEEMKKLSPLRAYAMSRNFGQTVAFGCGITNARGEIIVTMDGDLENQPEDIPALLAKLKEGYDLVAGWRQNRWHKQFFTRRLPSLAANILISKVTGTRLHDHGCNLRVYRKKVFDNIVFRGEMHRMLAGYLGMHGARIAEVPVSCARRKYGKSKYGLSRLFKVILDLLAFYFFRTYGTRPMHFFGYAGFFSMGFGALTFLWASYLRIFQGVHFNRTPLPELVAIFIIVGFQFILMGLLAEIFVRMKSSKVPAETVYEVRERIENR